MEGFTPLSINLAGDDAWPELREQDFGSGMATHVAVLPNGTSGGDMSDGIPSWPPLPAWAVEEVRQLRADYDEAIS